MTGLRPNIFGINQEMIIKDHLVRVNFSLSTNLFAYFGCNHSLNEIVYAILFILHISLLEYKVTA
jgi:hypothetical protein